MPLTSIRRRRHRSRGQAVTEFALIMPLLLAFFGASLDFARVFQAWIALEGATRDAAEAAATTAKTSDEALSTAAAVICAQTSGLSGYVPSGSTCSTPSVAIGAYTLSTSAPGATTRNPIATVTVSSALPFSALFAYPFITQDGAWTIRVSATYAIVQGR